MRALSFLALAASLFALLPPAHGGDSRREPALRAIAVADTAAVAPESGFGVTLSLQNLTSVVQTITIPSRAWDRTWKSSNRRVTWDAWDCDDNANVAIAIPAHETFVFPRPLKMFVNGVDKKSRIQFRMGFTALGKSVKTLWTAPVTLDITP